MVARILNTFARVATEDTCRSTSQLSFLGKRQHICRCMSYRLPSCYTWVAHLFCLVGMSPQGEMTLGLALPHSSLCVYVRINGALPGTAAWVACRVAIRLVHVHMNSRVVCARCACCGHDHIRLLYKACCVSHSYNGTMTNRSKPQIGNASVARNAAQTELGEHRRPF